MVLYTHNICTKISETEIQISYIKEHHLFRPTAFESLGCCGPETKEFLADLGKRVRNACGESGSLDYVYQKISSVIQRGNAACIFGTFGNRKCEDFYLLYDFFY